MDADCPGLVAKVRPSLCQHLPKMIPFVRILGHRKAFYNLLDLGRSVSPRAKCLANNWFAGAWVEAGSEERHDDEDQLDLDDIVLHSVRA